MFVAFLYGKHKYQLGNASFFLVPYHINQLCILGEMLRVPVMTLNYEPGIVCDNVFSMRPDPLLMNQAIISMIREDRPRVVAVVIEGNYCCNLLLFLLIFLIGLCTFVISFYYVFYYVVDILLKFYRLLLTLFLHLFSFSQNISFDQCKTKVFLSCSTFF